MGRIVPEADANLAKQLEDKKIDLKQLKTRRNMGMTPLPARLELAAQARIRAVGNADFRKDSKRLISIIYNMKLPDDEFTRKQKRRDIKVEMEIRDKLKMRPDHQPDETQLHEEDIQAKDELTKLIDGTLENRRRDWHYYEYDEYASDLYMAVRLAPNYACLRTIMNEIRVLDPSFEPKSVLDFGSGMGTTCWAVKETWPNSVQEFMNIELSRDQQYLCEFLLRGGKEFGKPLADVYHRQYLPTSGRVKYDMVVAAFSMLEVPNMEMRTQIIENLWSKTNDLLVIVERGNRGGFAIVNEARHFILDITGHKVTRRINLSFQTKPKLDLKIPESHVLAPCPHEFLCPRTSMPTKKMMDVCRFRVVFEPLEFGERKSGFVGEEFSYIVMRKKPHPSYYDMDCPRWPRVVEKRKHASQQVTHKLCCPNGNLAEAIFTRKKYGSAAQDIAKSCDWGDTIPIKVKDTYN